MALCQLQQADRHLISSFRFAFLSDIIACLVDNAINAQATKIDLVIDFDHLSVEVSDNGNGISEEDMSVVGLPFYSSMDSENSHGISLFQLSQICLLSIESNQLKTFVKRSLDNKNLPEMNLVIDSSDQSQIWSTVISLSDIFYNLPVRRGYLLNEYRPKTITSINNVLRQISLSHDVSICCRDKSSQITLFHASAHSSTEQRVLNFLGKDVTVLEIVRKEFTFTCYYLEFSTLVDKKNSKSSYVFVNNVSVEVDLESVKTKLRTSSCVIFIKTSVNEEFVGPKRLSTSWMLKKLEQWIHSCVEENISQSALQAGSPYKKRKLGREVTTGDFTSTKNLRSHDLIKVSRDDLQNCKAVGIFQSSFIVATLSNKRVVAIDQHAAHERILFESLQNQWLQGMTIERKLCMKFSPTEMESIDEQSLRLAYWGFQFEKVNNIHLCTLTIPSILEFATEAYCREYILELIISQESANLYLCQRACKLAIKFGDEITLETANQLINQLSRCDFPFQCAHGRPTIVPIVKLVVINE